MINFFNKTELPLEGLQVLGLTDKEGTNKIGQFGTGLKMALAYLAREGIETKIKTGPSNFTLAVEQRTFRDKTYKAVILISDNAEVLDLGITTNLAKNWELWQVFRELYSNAKDEGGSASKNPVKATTVIEVNSPKMAAMLDGEDEVLAPKGDILFENEIIQIIDAETSCIYYQGMRASEMSYSCRYTYNFKKIRTHDSRMIDYWEAKSTLEKDVLPVLPYNVLRLIWRSRKYEKHLSLYYIEITPEVYKEIHEAYKAGDIGSEHGAYKLLNENHKFKIGEPSKKDFPRIRKLFAHFVPEAQGLVFVDDMYGDAMSIDKTFYVKTQDEHLMWRALVTRAQVQFNTDEIYNFAYDNFKEEDNAGD